MDQFHDARKLLILLYASPEHIMKNIRKRNRLIEQGIGLQYIQAKQELLIEELPKYPFNKVIRIDCDKENTLDDLLVDKLAREIQCFEASITNTSS